MRRFILLSLLMILCLFIGVLPVTTQESPSTEINRANVTAWALYARNAQMLDLNLALYSPDYVNFSPFNPTGAPVTPEEMVAGEEVWFTAFPDMTITHFLVLAEGDYTAFIGYQEGTFEGEYYGTQPTGEYIHGQLVAISQYDENGMTIRDYNSWDQQGFSQSMGWLPADYTLDAQPWDVTLGHTSTSPQTHHALLNAMFTRLGFGSTNGFTNFYAPDVVVHDYLGDLTGAETVIAFHQTLLDMPEFTPGESHIVCEGDLCAVWASATVTPEDDPVPVVWFSLYRFVDGKIVEEWWLYDNAALWSVMPPTEYMNIS